MFRRIRVSTVIYCMFCFLLGTSFVVLIVDPETCNTFSIRSSGSVKFAKVESNIFLVIAILSHPDGLQRRSVIRKSWLKIKTDQKVRHYFVLGTKFITSDQNQTLQSEQQRFKDLILLSHIEDNYTELTKKVLYSFHWVNKHLDYKFLLKCDDDSFVNLDKLANELMSKPSTRLYWGFFDGRAPVHKTGTWEEKEWFLCDRYLPYAKGGGYVLSSDIINFIVENRNFLQLYNSEDVSIGTWTAALNINRVHEPRFDTEYKSRGCFNSYLIAHKQSIRNIEEKYDNLNHLNQICREEYRSRLSYDYNWKVLPSKCCNRTDSTIP